MHDPEAIYQDADIEMMELTQMGNDIANGVCPRCEEPLDPSNPKWDKIWTERYTKENAIKYLGTHGNIVEGYHDKCMTEMEDY